MNSIHVLGISGSLRKSSYNTAILHAASAMLPEGMSLEIYDLSALPLYNADNDGDNIPESVRQFKARVTAADALLFATPEYNYSVSGVLKNAIDWASRPAGKSPLIKKTAAIMGASTGNFGTVRAQMHLRDICVYNNMLVVPQPEVLIMKAKENFDAHGKLTNELSRDLIRKLLVALAELTRRMKSERELAPTTEAAAVRV
ncbi:MAG: NAD(P)H-dependent oxidoreductase [Anaerolineae bacterium]|nr:NAD(P)H-dependent oxidoreductase [Anaerolineae bacterium]